MVAESCIFYYICIEFRNMEVGLSKKGVLVLRTEDRLEHILTLISISEMITPMSEKEHLSNSERQFLANCIDLDRSGIRIGSTRAITELKKRLKKSTRSIYNLRSKLKDKSWLVQDEDGYRYSSLLKKKELNINLEHGD